MFTVATKKSTRPIAFAARTSVMELRVLKATPYKFYYTADEGVVILAGDELYKYDPDFNLLFKSNISNLLKFPDLLAYTIVVSDEKATYILEVKENSNEKVSIVHIGPKGEARQQSYEIGINNNRDFTAFIANGKLCVLGKNTSSKADKVVYTYYYINPEDDKLTSRKLDLPVDDYEYEQIKDGAAGDYFWKYLANHGDNVILVKSYFKKPKGEKKHSFVCNLLEIDMQGNTSNHKSIHFEPKLAGEDREFVAPQFVFDPTDESIYLAGYMEIDKKKINGLYLLKYNYDQGSLIYNKEYNFRELMKPEIEKNLKVHYVIPEGVDQAYPLVIPRNDFLVDHVNKFLHMRIITDYGFNNTSFVEVSFDKYGDHIKTAVTHYPAFINFYRGYIPNPTEYQLVWTDKTRPHAMSAKASPWDFINSKVDKKDSNMYWVPFSTTRSNSVVRYNSDERSFTGIVLTR